MKPVRESTPPWGLFGAVLFAAVTAVFVAAVMFRSPPPFPSAVPVPTVPLPTVPVLSDRTVTGLTVRATVRFRSATCGSVFTGSGFAVGPHTLVTNRHVAGGADRVEVDTWDGRPLHIKEVRVAADPSVDLAWVTVTETLPVRLRFERTAPQVGEKVQGFGFPHGGVGTSSQGLVVRVGPDRVGVISVISDVATVDGDSGGPLINAAGEVVGVTRAALDRESFAVPADVAVAAQSVPDRGAVCTG